MIVPEQLMSITLKLLYFFVPEALTWALIDKKGNRFSFRFSRVKGHPQLRPFAKTWVIAVIILFITLFSQDVFEWIMGQKIHDLVAAFGVKLFYLTVSLGVFSFLWVYNYLLEKRWDKTSWISGGVIALMSILFFFT